MSARDRIDLQISAFRGVAANVDIELLGKNPTAPIKTTDEILCALEFNTESAIATMKDITSDIAVSRNGYIKNTGSPTSAAYKGLLFWNRVDGSGENLLEGLCLKVSVVTGGLAAAELTMTGSALNDKLLAVFQFTTAASIASMKDITHLCSIPAAGKVACSASTASDVLLVFWQDVDGAAAINIPDLKFIVCDGAADGVLTATGIVAADTLLAALLFETKASVATVTDDLANCSITGAAEVTSTTDSTNDQYLLIYHNAS